MFFFFSFFVHPFLFIEHIMAIFFLGKNTTTIIQKLEIKGNARFILFHLISLYIFCEKGKFIFKYCEK